MNLILCISYYTPHLIHLILCISFHTLQSVHRILCIWLYAAHSMQLILCISFHASFSMLLVIISLLKGEQTKNITYMKFWFNNFSSKKTSKLTKNNTLVSMLVDLKNCKNKITPSKVFVCSPCISKFAFNFIHSIWFQNWLQYQ